MEQIQLPKNKSEVAEAYVNQIRDSFSYFVEEIIGFKNEVFHNDLDDIISNTAYKKIALAAPRGSGKSNHTSVAFPLWMMAKNHNLRILLVSNTATLSSGFISQMLDHIDRNEKYKAWARIIDPDGIGVVPKMREVAGMEMPAKWSSSAFTVERKELNIKESTVQAVGLFGSILSKRADIIIADDIVNQQNSESEEQRRKVKDWFDTTIKPCLVPGGRIIYVGNSWHPDDLIAHLLKSPEFDYRKSLKSIISEPVHSELWQEWADVRLDEHKPPEIRVEEAEQFYEEHKVEMEEGVQVLWPSLFPYKDLYLIKLSNPYSFARMYQCDPSERPDQKIKNEWLELAIKKGQDMMLQDEPRENLRMSIVTAGLDLAISLKKGSDDTVFLTLDRVENGDGNIKTGDYIIRNITRGKMTPNQVREMVKSKYKQINHNGIRVESVAYQESMVQDLEDFGFPVRGYHTGGEKFDPEIGVNSIALLLERGKLIIPYARNDARTIDECSKLLNELRSWPDGHTGDSLMALWFAFSEMNEFVTSGFTIPAAAWDVTDGAGKIEAATRQQLEKQADLDLMHRGQAERQDQKYVPLPKSFDVDDSEIRNYTF